MSNRRSSLSACGLFLLAIASHGSTASFAADAEVWIGTPASGNWSDASDCSGATFPSNACGLPHVHHDFDSDGNGSMNDGDWATDLAIAEGTWVKLYVAPQVSSDVITVKVERVNAACKFYNGGKKVNLGIYKGSTKIGSIIYAHLVNVRVQQGTTI